MNEQNATHSSTESNSSTQGEMQSPLASEQQLSSELDSLEIATPRELDADCLIIQEILTGNTNAFAVLQKKYNRQINSLLRRMVRDPDDVADLVQETFIKAYRALATFQCEHSFEKWLYKIASNNCIDYLRRKRFQMVSLDKPIGTNDGGEVYMEIPDPHSPQPDAGMIGSERTALIREAFNSLPEKYQEVIRMRHEEELEYNEISEKLNLPLGTVKAHIFRARQMMYKKLQKHSHIFNK